jgi:hypothetical protein
MRGTIIVGAALIAGLLGASSAFAQSDWQSMTCSDFLKLSPSDQASIAAKVGPTPEATSQTSNSGSGTANSSTTDNSNQMASATTATKGTAAGGPMAGQIVAACQAAPGTQTLHDTVSTPGAVSNGLGSGSNSK